jgi:hypothetical protein
MLLYHNSTPLDELSIKLSMFLRQMHTNTESRELRASPIKIFLPVPGLTETLLFPPITSLPFRRAIHSVVAGAR